MLDGLYIKVIKIGDVSSSLDSDVLYDVAHFLAFLFQVCGLLAVKKRIQRCVGHDTIFKPRMKQ